MEARLETANFWKLNRKKVKIKRALLLCFEADELATRVVVRRRIDMLDVRGLAA